MKIYLAALFALILSGCATQPPLVMTKEVRVPIWMPCHKAQVLPIHHLPIDDLRPGDAHKNSAAVWKALVETIQIQRSEIQERDTVLRAY